MKGSEPFRTWWVLELKWSYLFTNVLSLKIHKDLQCDKSND